MAASTLEPPTIAKSKAAPGLPIQIFNVVKDTVVEFMDDNCMVLAGAVAFSALQSIVPLILGFIAVGSLLLQDPATRADFVYRVEAAVPRNLSGFINLEDIIKTFIKGAGSATVLSVLILLWTGSGVFGQLKYAVNVAFDVKRDNRNILIQIGLQLLMLLVLGGLFIIAAAIGFLAGIVFNLKVSLFGISPYNFNFILPVLSYVLPILIEAAVFGILYRLSPARTGVKWRLVLFAGCVTAILFELLKSLFSLYLSIFDAADSATRTYGAIGGVFVFLFFLFLTSVVILFGAELAARLHNFRGGDGAMKTKEAVIETPTEEIQHELVPPHAAEEIKKAKDAPATPQPVGAAATATTTPAQPGQTTLTSTIIGGIVIVAVAIMEILLRRRIKN